MVCLPPPQNWVMGEGGRLGLAPAARDEANAMTKTETVTLLRFFTLLLPAGAESWVHPRNRKKGATPDCRLSGAWQGGRRDAVPLQATLLLESSPNFCQAIALPWPTFSVHLSPSRVALHSPRCFRQPDLEEGPCATLLFWCSGWPVLCGPPMAARPVEDHPRPNHADDRRRGMADRRQLVPCPGEVSRRKDGLRIL